MNTYVCLNSAAARRSHSTCAVRHVSHLSCCSVSSCPSVPTSLSMHVNSRRYHVKSNPRTSRRKLNSWLNPRLVHIQKRLGHRFRHLSLPLQMTLGHTCCLSMPDVVPNHQHRDSGIQPETVVGTPQTLQEEIGLTVLGASRCAGGSYEGRCMLRERN